VHDEYGALRTALELGRRLVLAQVEAPWKRGGGHAAAQPEELDAVKLQSLSVEDVGARPDGAGLPQLGVGLGVAGHEHGRRGDCAEHLDRALEAHSHRGVVADTEHYVGLSREVDQPLGAVPVAVQIAEGQELHRLLRLRRIPDMPLA